MNRCCSNEEADDIETGHLRYLRIPSLMADLQAQTSVQGPEARLVQLSQASRNYIRSRDAHSNCFFTSSTIVSEGSREVGIRSGWLAGANGFPADVCTSSASAGWQAVTDGDRQLSTAWRRVGRVGRVVSTLLCHVIY